jgi:hypothetical protein
MSRNADQIRQEIESSRGQLAQNLEAIGDKVSPKHVVESISDKVNPRRILNRQTEKVKDGLSSVGDSVLGRASGAANGVRSSIGGAAGSASGTASSVRDGAVDQVQSLGERMRSVSSSASGQLRSAPDSNPMASALVAFGAGLVVGLALPPSRTERQAAATVRAQVVEPVKQQAVSAGRAVAGELQPAAKSKVERVKRTATGAAERVKDEAKGAKADVQGQAGQAAKTVKGQARQATGTTKARAKDAAGTTKATVTKRAGRVSETASA